VSSEEKPTYFDSRQRQGRDSLVTATRPALGPKLEADNGGPVQSVVSPQDAMLMRVKFNPSSGNIADTRMHPKVSGLSPHWNKQQQQQQQQQQQTFFEK
jgi:hypothetical protein